MKINELFKLVDNKVTHGIYHVKLLNIDYKRESSVGRYIFRFCDRSIICTWDIKINVEDKNTNINVNIFLDSMFSGDCYVLKYDNKEVNFVYNTSKQELLQLGFNLL